MTYVQLGVHQDPQDFFCKAAFQTVCLQPILMYGVIPSQVQTFALPLVELHEITFCPFLQTVEVPVNSSTIKTVRATGSTAGVQQLPFSPLKVIKHRNVLPGNIVELLFLEIFKNHLDIWCTNHSFQF